MRALLLALLFCSAGLACRAQDVVVRSRIVPEAGAVVGQHMRVMIDVLFKDAMPRPPRVAIGEPAGAQILRIESQATTMSDRIDGQSYNGQRFEFALYARRGGTITVPAATVTLLDAKGDETGTLHGQELQVDIAVPPGVDPSAPVIATTKAALKEEWSPAPSASLKAGDALVRTVTRTAADVPAMAMLDLAFPAPPGTRVYVEPPTAEDSVDRGDLVGRRVDRATYVFEAAGAVSIPAVVQPWWDLEAGRLRQAVGDGVTVQVVAGAEPDRWRRMATAAVAAAIVLVLAGWVAAPRLHRAWAARHRRWLQSEAKAYRDLLAASRGGDLAGLYRAFVVWRRRSGPSPTLAALAEELEQVLFGDTRRSWSRARSAAFADACRAARKEMQRTLGQQRQSALPALNAAESRCRA